MNNQQWQGLIDQIPASAHDIERIGSRDAYNHFPWGWAWAGNTPFRRWKRENYRGGCAVPFVLSWPAGLGGAQGNRDGFVYVTDVVPTLLELLELEAPTSLTGVKQSPIEGVSFAPHLLDASAPSQHRIQYFETMGHRALVLERWRAVCPWPGTSWAEGGNWPQELLRPTSTAWRPPAGSCMASTRTRLKRTTSRRFRPGGTRCASCSRRRARPTSLPATAPRA